MKVEISNLRNGSCNFCKRGKLRKNNIGLDYPYDRVFTINQSEGGGGLTANICQECMDILKNKTEGINLG